MPPLKKKKKQIKRRVEIVNGVEVPLSSKRKPKVEGEEKIVYSSQVDAAIREHEQLVAAAKLKPVKQFTRLDEIKIDLDLHRESLAKLIETPKKEMALIDTYKRIIASIEAEEAELLSKKKKK